RGSQGDQKSTPLAQPPRPAPQRGRTWTQARLRTGWEDQDWLGVGTISPRVGVGIGLIGGQEAAPVRPTSQLRLRWGAGALQVGSAARCGGVGASSWVRRGLTRQRRQVKAASAWR